MSDNRRRESRVEVLGKVQGGVNVPGATITVIEMSLHGLGMESSCAFRVGTVHEFRLTLGDGASVEVLGRVLRCRQVDAPGAAPRYLSGVRFVDDDAQTCDSIAS